MFRININTLKAISKKKLINLPSNTLRARFFSLEKSFSNHNKKFQPTLFNHCHSKTYISSVNHYADMPDKQLETIDEVSKRKIEFDFVISDDIVNEFDKTTRKVFKALRKKYLKKSSHFWG